MINSNMSSCVIELALRPLTDLAALLPIRAARKERKMA